MRTIKPLAVEQPKDALASHNTTPGGDSNDNNRCWGENTS